MHNQVTLSSYLIDLTHQLSPNLAGEASRGFSCTYSDYRLQISLHMHQSMNGHMTVMEISRFEGHLHDINQYKLYVVGDQSTLVLYYVTGHGHGQSLKRYVDAPG